jgi:hypothetical protein
MVDKIAYGSNCTWWDHASNLSEGDGIPRCPHCGYPLCEVDESIWDAGIKSYSETNPGYEKLVRWVKRKCFSTYFEARQAWIEENRR